MFDINKVIFGADGLVPCATVDARTNEILMLAYMNKEALDVTLSSGRAHYFSRSRNKIWLKGETSGHFQEVVSVFTDCDSDAIRLRVNQTGAACHTGEQSCFFNEIKTFKDVAGFDILKKNIDTVKERKTNPVVGSYTNYLLDKGKEKICKKIGEESAEAIIAAMKSDNNELKCELADLYFHTLVLAESCGFDFFEVLDELQARHSSTRKREY